MRHPRLVALHLMLAGAFVLGPAVGSAGATTIEDLIKLKANRATPVSDDVLIALIESDGSVFHLTADDILPLKQKGLSERVIIAMLLTAKNARTPVDVVEPVVEPPAADTPDSYAYRQPEPLPPAVVNVTQQVTQTVESPQYETRTAYVPVYIPVAVRPVRPAPPPQPVYWGFGGKLRPDAWQPAPDPRTPAPDRRPDPKPDPRKPGGGQ